MLTASPGVLVTALTPLETGEDGSQAVFSVVLESPPVLPVAIEVDSSDTTEGVVDKSVLNFNLLNWDTPQLVVVTGVDDAVADGDVEFDIELEMQTLDLLYSAIDPDDITFTNIDDDAAGLRVSPGGGLVTTEAGGQTSFDVWLRTQPAGEVTVDLVIDDGGEASLSTYQLTFDEFNWNTPQTVIVTGVDDTDDDGDSPYNISVSAQSSDDSDYDGITISDISGSNLDDDPPPVDPPVDPPADPPVDPPVGGPNGGGPNGGGPIGGGPNGGGPNGGGPNGGGPNGGGPNGGSPNGGGPIGGGPNGGDGQGGERPPVGPGAEQHGKNSPKAAPPSESHTPSLRPEARGRILPPVVPGVLVAARSSVPSTARSAAAAPAAPEEKPGVASQPKPYVADEAEAEVVAAKEKAAEIKAIVVAVEQAAVEDLPMLSSGAAKFAVGSVSLGVIGWSLHSLWMFAASIPVSSSWAAFDPLHLLKEGGDQNDESLKQLARNASRKKAEK